MTYSENNITIRRIQDYENYLNGQGDSYYLKAYGNIMFPYIKDNGGNKKDVSLTVETVNDPTIGGDAVKEKWIKPENRRKSDLISTKPFFAFKETTKEKTLISNAFCFAGQDLSIYINHYGHLSGYFSEDYIYSRTKLKFTVTDVVLGQQYVVKEFDSFETELDDESRYFNISIPWGNDEVLNEYGMFGNIVLSMTCSFDFYKDAELTELVQIPINSSQTSYIQILTYSPGIEAKNVEDPCNVFKHSISGSESFNRLFEKSIFEYDSRKPILSDKQKRAIIADQIAVLFISQHPVITSDYTPMKIIGYGASDTIRPEHVLQRAITYSERYPEITPVAHDRFYGLLKRYKTFGFISEIESYFSSHNQSPQITRDPSRILFMDEDGNAELDKGVNGIVFNPFVIENKNAEVPKETESIFSFRISQDVNSIEIANIRILNNERKEISEETKDIIVSFDYMNENKKKNVSNITISIWSKNNLGYTEVNYEYEVGDIPNNEFFIKLFKKVSPSYNGDFIKAKIDILDVNGKTSTFYQDLFVSSVSNSPKIINLFAMQSVDGTGCVDIYYSYFGYSEINNTNIQLYYYEDVMEDTLSSSSLSTGGSGGWVLAKTTFGDIGYGVLPGNKSCKWYPWDEVSINKGILRLKLFLFDANENIYQTNEFAVQVSNIEPNISIKRVNQEELYGLYESSSSSLTSSSSTSISSVSSSSSGQESVSSSSSSSSSESISSISSLSTSSSSESSSSSTFNMSSSSFSTSSSSSFEEILIEYNFDNEDLSPSYPNGFMNLESENLTFSPGFTYSYFNDGQPRGEVLFSNAWMEDAGQAYALIEISTISSDMILESVEFEIKVNSSFNCGYVLYHGPSWDIIEQGVYYSTPGEWKTIRIPYNFTLETGNTEAYRLSIYNASGIDVYINNIRFYGYEG